MVGLFQSMKVNANKYYDRVEETGMGFPVQRFLELITEERSACWLIFVDLYE